MLMSYFLMGQRNLFLLVKKLKSMVLLFQIYPLKKRRVSVSLSRIRCCFNLTHCSNLKKSYRNDCQRGRRFLYIVSSLGVTGIRSEINTDLASIIKIVRENTDIPCAIGFGISTPKQANEMAKIADGVIVGSAIIKLLEKYGKDAPKYIGEYVKSMKKAL